MTTKTENYVPKKNGYVARKISDKTDIQILELAYKNRQNTIIKGPTGCGKTHSVRHLCHELKIPYMRVGLNGAITPEQLVGQYVPNEGGTGFKWQDGIMTKFVREGGVFVLDEINAAPAEILFILHSLLDDERRIVLTQKDGEVVEAHKDFWFVATMNEGYVGTRQMNPALLDRFSVVMKYDYDSIVEKKLIKNDIVLKMAAKTRNHKDEFRTPASTRSFLNFQENIEIYGEPIATEFFLSRYTTSEAEAIKSAIDLHKGMK